MDTLNLTPRLLAVANCVKKCNLLSDIGTDHAYIPIYAVKNKIAKKALACDIVKGPLKIATENIRAHGLEDKITPCLAKGLDSSEGADVIVIAGMGGKLILSIIEENLKTAKTADYMVLQPMTCSYELRKYLHGAGFKILNECLAKEDDKIYNIMVVSRGEESYEDEFYYHIGKRLFDARDCLLSDYIRYRGRVIKKQFEGMSRAENEAVIHNAAALKSLYERFLKEADIYDKSL